MDGLRTNIILLYIYSLKVKLNYGSNGLDTEHCQSESI